MDGPSGNQDEFAVLTARLIRAQLGAATALNADTIDPFEIRANLTQTVSDAMQWVAAATWTWDSRAQKLTDPCWYVREDISPEDRPLLLRLLAHADEQYLLTLSCLHRIPIYGAAVPVAYRNQPVLRNLRMNVVTAFTDTDVVGVTLFLENEQLCRNVLLQEVFNAMAVQTANSARRRFVERELVRRETELQIALWAGGMATWVYDLKSGYVNGSRARIKLLALPPYERGEPMEAHFKRIHPDDVGEVYASFTRAIAQRTIYEAEYRVVWPDGSIHWIGSMGQVFFDEDHEPERIYGAMMEITGRKQIEESLHTVETQYQRIVNNVPGIVFRYRGRPGVPGAFSMISENVRNMYGLEPEEIINDPTSMLKLVHPEDLLTLRACMIESQNSLSPLHWEGRIVKANGEVRWVEVTATPELLTNGEVIHDGILLDQTQRKHQDEKLASETSSRRNAEENLAQATTQLIQSAKLASLGTLAAGVAHELNQPLAVIRGMTQQLEADVPEEFRPDLTVIEGQTSRMIKIIQHLRTFCRSDQVNFEPVTVNQVIRDCFILVSAQLRNHGVRVDLDLCAEAPPVPADRNQLEQVFLNLITNAADAMEGVECPVLQIRSWTDAGKFCIEFRDNGSGIPEHVLSRIFDPFFTTKGPGKGTGLGLSISHNLIGRHSGDIRAHNDHGAVFTIELPTTECLVVEPT